MEDEEMYDEEWLRRRRESAWMVTGASVVAVIVWCFVMVELLEG